jgi:hypothetical protein
MYLKKYNTETKDFCCLGTIFIDAYLISYVVEILSNKINRTSFKLQSPPLKTNSPFPLFSFVTYLLIRESSVSNDLVISSWMLCSSNFLCFSITLISASLLSNIKELLEIRTVEDRSSLSGAPDVQDIL